MCRRLSVWKGYDADFECYCELRLINEIALGRRHVLAANYNVLSVVISYGPPNDDLLGKATGLACGVLELWGNA